MRPQPLNSKLAGQGERGALEEGKGKASAGTCKGSARLAGFSSEEVQRPEAGFGV